MRSAIAVSVLAALSACTPATGPITGAGIDMTDFFTFTVGAQESWEFLNRNRTDISYQLIADTSDIVEETPDGLVFAVTWSRYCLNATDIGCRTEDLHTVKWRVESSKGVFVPALVPQGAVALPFEPNIQVLEGEMSNGDVVQTVTGGYTFTSTYEGFAECPVNMSVEWGDDCIQFTLTDGDEDLNTNAGLTGTYWMIPGFDFVGYKGEADPDVWELSRYDCEGEC